MFYIKRLKRDTVHVREMSLLWRQASKASSLEELLWPYCDITLIMKGFIMDCCIWNADKSMFEFRERLMYMAYLFLIPQWSESQTKSQIKHSLNKHFACCVVVVTPVVEKHLLWQWTALGEPVDIQSKSSPGSCEKANNALLLLRSSLSSLYQSPYPGLAEW